MSYNVKVYDYNLTGEQEYRFYTKPVRKSDEPKIVPELTLDEQIDKVMLTLIPKENTVDKMRSITESTRRTKQKIYQYARANNWDYFCTYTFNPKLVNSSDYDICYKAISNHFKYIKKKYAPDLKYIIIPELHKDGLKYHFHALITDVGSMLFTESGKYDKKGKPIYNISSYTLGFSTAVKIGQGESAKVSNYITKYITKSLVCLTQGRQRYLVSKNAKVPEEQELFLDNNTITLMKEALLANSVSDKVVKILVDNYENEVTYINVKVEK